MEKGSRGALVRQIDEVFRTGTLSGVPDGRLLERFVAQRDEVALEVLIARHQSLVLGVCRRFLRDPNDVEDAFQATLLVLVRQARTIRVRDSLGPWLYGVAYRIAVRARANARRRESLDGSRLRAEAHPSEQGVELDRRELQPILYEELNGLPEQFRAPIVLCYLEGLTHEAAARQLQCPLGTVRSRLARGREKLQSRLSRRGVVCSAGLISSALFAKATSAALPHRSVGPTILAARRVAAGAAIAEVASASVVALMEGVLKSMITTRIKYAAGALLVCGILGLGAVVQAYQAPPPPEDSPKRKEAKQAAILEAAAPRTFHKTYYVGDLIMPAPPIDPLGAMRSSTNSPRDDAPRPKVDMQPLIDLITRTVNPRTWIIPGDPVRGEATRTRIGSATPFYLSISLIIRHDAETHDRIADLFRGLRRLRDLQESWRSGEREELGPPATATGAGVPAKAVDMAAQRASRNAELAPSRPASDAGKLEFDELHLRTGGSVPPRAPRGSAERTNSDSTRRRPRPGGDDAQHLRELLKEMSDEIELLIRERDEAKAAHSSTMETR